MINEQRTILMTRLAMHDKREGKENKNIGTYFRSDYIGMRLIGCVISATISFFLGFGLYVLYDSENFVNTELAGKILLYYVIFVVAYSLIAYIVFAFRYRKARSRLKVYFNNLRRLQILYQRERKERRQ